MLISKIAFFASVLILVFVLTACGNSSSGPVASNTPGGPGASNAPPTSGTPAPIVSTNYSKAIVDVAGRSTCAQYSWKSRGRAPAGYIKGVALAYARSVCRLKTANPRSLASVIMSSADTRDDARDALAHYGSIFSNLNIPINTQGVEAMRAVYTLGIGSGMRESSGNYCTGWDTSAGSNRPSSAAEAGAFQVSYDSIGASPELQRLYDEYQADTSRCDLNIFKEGVSCSNQSILGTGAGADFQKFNKACPAFAAEYSMTLLRVLRSHFGPINRLEAEVQPTCYSMLTDVQKIIDSNPNAVCTEVY